MGDNLFLLVLTFDEMDVVSRIGLSLRKVYFGFIGNVLFIVSSKL